LVQKHDNGDERENASLIHVHDHDHVENGQMVEALVSKHGKDDEKQSLVLRNVCDA